MLAPAPGVADVHISPISRMRGRERADLYTCFTNKIGRSSVGCAGLFGLRSSYEPMDNGRLLGRLAISDRVLTQGAGCFQGEHVGQLRARTRPDILRHYRCASVPLRTSGRRMSIEISYRPGSLSLSQGGGVTSHRLEQENQQDTQVVSTPRMSGLSAADNMLVPIAANIIARLHPERGIAGSSLKNCFPNFIMILFIVDLDLDHGALEMVGIEDEFRSVRSVVRGRPRRSSQGRRLVYPIHLGRRQYRP